MCKYIFAAISSWSQLRSELVRLNCVILVVHWA